MRKQRKIRTNKLVKVGSRDQGELDLGLQIAHWSMPNLPPAMIARSKQARHAQGCESCGQLVFLYIDYRVA